MPFRETYEINNREEGKAAQRDQSYKSCTIALLIFFFLCLILIVACIPWKIQHLMDNTDNTHNTDQQIGEESEYGKQTKQTKLVSLTTPIRTTSTTVRTTSTPIRTTSTPIRTTSTTTTVKTTKKGPINTEEYVWQNVTEAHIELSSQNAITKKIVIPPVIVPEEKADHYTPTTKKILQYTENAEKDIGLTQHDVVTDNIIDNDATSILPGIQIHYTTTTKHHVIDAMFTEKSLKENTTEYSLNENQNTLKSEFLTENSIDFDKFDITKVDTVTEDTIASTTSNPFIINVEGNTDTKYISDKHDVKSQFNISTSNLTTSTSSARPVFENITNIEEFTTKYSNYNESMISENHRTSINEIVTTESSSIAEENILPIDETVPPTMEIKNKTENSTLSTNSYETAKKHEHITSHITEKYSVSSMNNYTTTIASSVFYNNNKTVILENQTETSISTTEEIRLPDQNATICETGHCKQVAGKMLSYMNHSADPCEDFYEYTCGGFEANPQLVDGDTVLRFRNYQRIARQMSKREYKDSTFATYYDSCVQYEKTKNFSERVKMASDALSKIGEFYTPATWSNNVDFTDLFTQLILHHSAFLFDVVPVLDEHSPNNFTQKIGPAMYESSFMEEHVEDLCSEDKFGIREHYVDLQVLYNNYKRCKNDTRELIKSIKEALTVFNIFKSVNDNYLEWHAQLEHIEKIVHIIDSIIMQEYFSQFPSKIQEKYSMDNYNKISLEELENSSTFINWTQLINSLGMDGIDGNVQVYVYTGLIENLQKLEEFNMKDPMSLNNAIMGMYAHKLYRELVIPRRNNVKDHCLQMAIYLLRLEASSLYISSFADHEIIQMNKIMEDTFNELKQTLRLEMEKMQWTKGKGRELLLEKIDNLKLALPAIFYFQNIDSLYNEYNMPQIVLHDNYFNNSMILLKRYRTLMYAELKGQADDPKQIWTYYATPFQSQARVIYNLYLNVIPYGVIDWSMMNNEFSFNYFVLATLGNLIAHQIAHHFDTNGIYYWNHIKNSQKNFMYEDHFTDMNLEDYMHCHKNNLYQESMNVTLPFTDQVVSFTIPQSTLNKRLSDIMGLRLAYDTLVRTMSDAEEGLPWIKLRTEQLFYLAYAQMYCTKKPLTSSYVSLYESEDLPSRIRVFVSASNNKPLAEMWNCATGSQVAPLDVCSVFPYVEFKETVSTNAQ